MLDIGMSELMNSDVNEICEAARTSLNDTHPDSESLNDGSNVGLEPSHQGCNPFDARGVARINPLSDFGCNSDSLNFSNDIGSFDLAQNRANTYIVYGYVVFEGQSFHVL